jgi:MATE family multidrug resistance protein
MLISAVFLVLFREDFGRLYSTDPEVLKIVADNVILLGIIVVFDGIQVGLFRVRQPFMNIFPDVPCTLQGINSGILRGAGLPTAAARINLMSYWLFGLPVVRASPYTHCIA